MKVLIGAAAVAMILAVSPAFAQTAASANCTGFEAVPTLPDGATATRQQMQAAITRFEAWDAARQQKLVACRADIDANSAAFTTVENERRAAQSAWGAEIAEFNARGSASSSSSRHGGGASVTRPDHE